MKHQWDVKLTIGFAIVIFLILAAFKGPDFSKEILNIIVEVNNQTNLFNHEYILHIYELSKSNKFKQHLYSLFVFSLWFKKEYLS